MSCARDLFFILLAFSACYDGISRLIKSQLSPLAVLLLFHVYELLVLVIELILKECELL